MRIKYIFLLFLILTFTKYSFSQILPDDTQISALNRIKNEKSYKINVDWNKINGSPEIITFSNPVIFNKDQEKSAELFLKEIKGLLKYRSNYDTLIVKHQKEHQGNKYICYQQKYQNIPVKGGEYVVTVLPNGSVRTALGSFFKDISVKTKPNISYNEALRIVLTNPPSGYQLKDSLYSSELLIYPQQDKYYLVYELHIAGIHEGESWCYIIDAHTGNLLNMANDIIFVSKANVYLRHPGLDGSYTTISPLPNLSGNGYLHGTYANILNKNANDGYDEAYNANNDFRYTPSNTHFDEANLYYHIDKIASFFHNMGFNEFTQITAHAHIDFYDGDSAKPNASYSPNDHHLRFSDGQGVLGFNSFAREDKVIYHEYTHAITDFVANLSFGNSESGAIHEGNSDYFASSFTDRVLINEYSCEDHEIYQRDISNPRISTYTQYMDPNLSYWLDWGYHEPHFGGELWSACLWDLKEELDASTTDELVYRALDSNIPTSCTFLQYRQEIIDADIDMNNGCNVNSIKHIFYIRGIGSDAESVTTSGTLQSDETWYCTQTLQGNVTVPSNITLTIYHGAIISIPSGKTITVNGTLNAIGKSGSSITFNRSGSSGSWGGIDFGSNGEGHFQYCTFKNANTAITKSSSGNVVSISDCEFRYNGTCIEGYYNSCQQIYIFSSDFYAWSDDCIYLYDSGAYIHGNRIDGQAEDVDGIEIRDNWGEQEGVAIYENDIFGFDRGIYFYEGAAMVQMCDIYNNSFGIYARTYSYPYFREGSWDGKNVITDNGTGIYISSYSDADLSTSLSTIAANSYRNVSNYTSNTIYASYNYWGAVPPPTSKFYGSISYTYYLTSDATGRYPSGYMGKLALTDENSSTFAETEVLDEDTPAGMKEKYNQARELTRSDNLTDANVLFKEVIDLNPDHTLAISAFHHLIRNNNRVDKTATSLVVQEILSKYPKSNVSAWALKYQISEAAKSGQYDKAVTLSNKIVAEFPELSVAKDALFEEWIIKYILLNDIEAAKEVIANYETKYGLDENLVRMKVKSGLIDAETAKDLKKQIFAESSADSKETTDTLLPEKFALKENYPNPFNPSTTIQYDLPEDVKVVLEVFDIQGQKVKTLVNGFKIAGYYEVIFDGSHLASGVYIYKIKAGDFSSSKRMLLIK